MASSPEAVSTGVLQGSLLGRLLFILHVYDLTEATSECNILCMLSLQSCSVRPLKSLLLKKRKKKAQ